MASTLAGVQYIRKVQCFVDNRSETLNENKTIKELIEDYIKATGDKPDGYLGFSFNTNEGHRQL